ncbi:MAG: O-antigen ligase family protein [Candidatus Shapirobacteria bacterium]|nr:O-antigen ligase family protein [Candidatus Shapirobacteria bacterium]
MFKNIKFNIFRPILGILLVFIPLYPKFPLFSVSDTYVAIRLDDIVVAIAAIIWLIYQIKNKFPIFKVKITRLVLIYFLAIIVSFINAYLIYQTELTNILILHLFRRFEYISLFFICLEAIKSIKDFRFLYIFFLVSTALVSFYGYGQKYLQFPVISTMNSEFSKGQLIQMNIWTRISSTFAGHYDLAAFMSLALVIILAVAITSKNIFTKIFSFLVWIPSYQILTLTASRISIFAFLGGACVTLFLLKKYWWIIPVAGLVTFSIFNSDDLNQRIIATIPALKNQFFSTQNQPNPQPTLAPTAIPTATSSTPSTVTSGEVKKPTPTVVRHQAEEYPIVDADVGVARSGEIRFNAEWPRAINAWKKNLLIGSGLGSITLATDNDYLRCLGESGLLGLITFGSIFIFFIIKSFPLFFKKSFNNYDLISIIFFGCMLTMLANATFIDVFEASKVAYFFWIIMALYHQSLNIKNKEQ